MKPVRAATEFYYQRKDDGCDQVFSEDSPLTEIALGNMFSTATESVSFTAPSQRERSIQPLKRPFSQETLQSIPKRQRIITQTREIISRENDEGARAHIPINLSQTLSLKIEQAPESFHDMITKIARSVEENEEIKNKCVILPVLFFEYYQNVSNKEFKGLSDEAFQMDSLEAQAVLGDIQGSTWWIRKGFFSGEECYKGIVYLDRMCFHYVLYTNNDLIVFFNTISSIPDLEALRREKIEKINKIKSEYIAHHPSSRYYQAIFEAESKGLFDKAANIASVEVKSILGCTQGQTWWIQKDFTTTQESYNGVVYLNGKRTYFKLSTDNELINFVNRNSSIVYLETLRRERISKIKNEYIVQPSSEGYYQAIFEAESKGLLDEAVNIASLEVKFILGGTQGQTWWIQKDFTTTQECYNGIVYLNGECTYSKLSTDNELIDFVNGNSSIVYLETLRRERISKIKNEYIVHSSSEGYYQAIFEAESKGLFDEAANIASVEVKSILGCTQGQTWWIQKDFTTTQESYNGVVYLNEKCSFYKLSADNGLIDFVNNNSPNLYLETLRRERISKIKNEYIVQPSSEGYYQAIFEAESKGLLDEAVNIASLEVKFILGGTQGQTWWIQKDFTTTQESYNGIVYLNGECTYSKLSTDNELIDFVNGNSSIVYLETLRRERINKIKNEYIAHLFSSRYYQAIFEAESKGLFNKAANIASIEVKSILGCTQGQTWWIQRDFSISQEFYNGIVYLNGECSFYRLSADNGLIDFVNNNSPNLYLEILRREKVSKIKNEYIVDPSAAGYYQAVFEAESQGLIPEALQMTIFEAQTVLGGVQGVTWWIRKGFHDNQEIYKGIVYLNGECLHYILPADNDMIAFFNKNHPDLYLETLRSRKLTK